jgi:hypothetical protein
MSRKRHDKGHQRFIALNHYMLKSPAWKTLPPNAKALLLSVWERHNGSNNGQISYSVREAEEIGLSKDQAGRAIEELIERGFIVCTRASAFSVKTRAARLWRLTAEASTGHPATKDFMRWVQPGVKAGVNPTRGPKSKTQSHQRDVQSHQRDCGLEIEIIEPLTVAPARLSAPISIPSQSHQRDTYILPGGYVPDRTALAAAEQPRASLWPGVFANPTAWVSRLGKAQSDALRIADDALQATA